MDTPMTPSEFEELAAGYVLGALEPDDEHRFQRHLGGCPACAVNFRELEAVAAGLAYAASPVDPPGALWAGIRRQIEPEAAGPGATDPIPAAAGAGRPGWRRLLPGLGAAAAILLGADDGGLEPEPARPERRHPRPAGRPGGGDPAGQRPQRRAGGARRHPGPEAAQATVITSSRQDRGVLLVQSLPPLARGRVYELWCLPQGEIKKAQKALIFVPLRRQGVLALEFEVPVQPGTEFAITDEPGPHGSEQPTNQPLLAGAPPSA